MDYIFGSCNCDKAISFFSEPKYYNLITASPVQLTSVPVPAMWRWYEQSKVQNWRHKIRFIITEDICVACETLISDVKLQVAKTPINFWFFQVWQQRRKKRDVFLFSLLTRWAWYESSWALWKYKTMLMECFFRAEPNIQAQMLLAIAALQKMT